MRETGIGSKNGLLSIPSRSSARQIFPHSDNPPTTSPLLRLLATSLAFLPPGLLAAPVMVRELQLPLERWCFQLYKPSARAGTEKRPVSFTQLGRACVRRETQLSGTQRLGLLLENGAIEPEPRTGRRTGGHGNRLERPEAGRGAAALRETPMRLAPFFAAFIRDKCSEMQQLPEQGSDRDSAIPTRRRRALNTHQ
jgi:hypothetical protein